MKYYFSCGFHNFIICLGCKQHVVKEHFTDYFPYTSDVTFDLSSNSMGVLQRHAEPWRMTLIGTGLHAITDGRAKCIRDYVGDEPFLLTYGDGVSDMNPDALLVFHRGKQRIATIMMMNIEQVRSMLNVGDNREIHSLRKKDDGNGAVINGGSMVCEPGIFGYIADDDTILEQEPFRDLCRGRGLAGYYRRGF